MRKQSVLPNQETSTLLYGASLSLCAKLKLLEQMRELVRTFRPDAIAIEKRRHPCKTRM